MHSVGMRHALSATQNLDHGQIRLCPCLKQGVSLVTRELSDALLRARLLILACILCFIMGSVL